MKKCFGWILMLMMLVPFIAEAKTAVPANNDVKVLNETNFAAETAKGFVLVDFWATWCPPCRKMSPIIDEIATEYKGKVSVGKVDVDSNEKLAAKFQIRSIPTLILFKDGKKINQIIGAVEKKDLKSFIQRNIDKK